ncbi:hypothetical protein BW730_05255 [Tessaracoccus aquimaris]|uniref:Gram-positive cocci surface proteins LPxTG domain-containing protein n=1 Tax=Tessaracoccus aquimaris TaxID=1332264 RepID=A0A1Q2CLS7_9ACTN|nr:hypothetical protein BW730_05255 [Tessaracoccus aquimaris]
MADAQEVAPRDTFAGETCWDLNPWPGLVDLDGSDAADLGVATYVGGDLRVLEKAAELEGLTLVRGEAIFDRTPGGTVNVGIVGEGSHVKPPLKSTMLAIEGDMGLSEGTRVAVGEGTDAPRPQGKLRVGGQLDADQGQVTSFDTQTGLGGEALPEEFRGFDRDIAATQRFLSDLEGHATITSQWGRATIELGTGLLHGLQVATVGADDLSDAREIDLSGIDPDGHVVINVTGGSVDLEVASILIEGELHGFGEPEFGEASARVLWNFVDATDIRFGSEVKGTQWIGSIVTGPEANVETLFSHNGRLYVDGDLTMRGEGTELHNFGWTWGFECDERPTGSFSITKNVVDPEGLSATDMFTGTWSCELDGAVVKDGTWSLGDAVTQTVTDIPVGASCTVSEDELVDPAGGTWSKEITPPDFDVTGTDHVVEVVVTNTLEANAPEIGGFAITKKVVNESMLEFTDEFHGTWSCEYNDEHQDGSWTLIDGATFDGPELLVGSTCTVAEDDVVDPEGGTWLEPVIEPSEFTITADGEIVAVTVTNTLEAKVTEPEVTEPEVTEPEVTEPEVTEPEVTEPEVTEPEVTEPEVTEPEVTEPEVTEPEVTEPEVTEPEVTEPKEPGPGLPDTGALGTGTAIAGVIALIGAGVIALFRIGRRSTTA